MGLEGYREEVSVLNLRGKFEVRNAGVPWRCLWLGEVFLTSWGKSVMVLRFCHKQTPQRSLPDLCALNEVFLHKVAVVAEVCADFGC